MRIAVVYDCLYPYTIGGAERWYRNVAQRLAARHQVTFITRRQWPRGTPIDAPPGTEVVVVSGGEKLYTTSGRRKISVPLRFGWGVLVHLLANRTKYDAVHTCGFPYFSLLAARAAQKLGGPPVVADWFEVWGRDYWNTYLGGIGGALGNAVERTCVRATEDAFVFSRLGAERLRAAGYDARPVVLRGMYAAGADGTQSFDMSAVRQREPLVVFVGRHIAEKRVTAIPQAVAIARERIPDLHAAIFGDGPERHRVISEIQRLGLKEIIAVPGFSPWPDVERTLSSAMCLILPSHREGYGLAVVEAAAYGTPAVVARHPDSAAVELISEGQNGFIAASSDPRDLADALVRIHSAGAKLTQTTNEWFVANEHELSIETSIATIEAVYARIVKEAR